MPSLSLLTSIYVLVLQCFLSPCFFVVVVAVVFVAFSGQGGRERLLTAFAWVVSPSELL